MQLDSQMDGLENSLQKLGAEMDDFTRDTREAMRGTDRLGHEMRDTARDANHMAAAMQFAGRAGAAGLGLMGTAIAGITTGLMGITVAAGATAAAVGTLGIATGIKFNANQETALISWEAILKDAQKAKDTVTDIQRLGALTPFETENLDKSARLLTLANLGGENLVQTLTSLGDAVAISGGTGDTLEGVSMALFQMSAKGKIQAEEMMQLAERGMDPWNALAKEMGKTTAELMEMSSNGELLAKDTLPLLVKGLGDAFAGGMQKQAKTFNGMVSTLKDNMKILLGIVTKPLFDKMVANMPRLIAFLDVLTAQTKYFGMHGFFSTFFGKEGADNIVSAWNDIKSSAKSAWDYLDTHFLSNPDFKNLDIKGKIGFVFDDLMETFKAWFDEKGKTMIATAGSDLTQELSDSLIANSPRIIDAAFTIGGNVATAFLRGIHLKLAEMMPDWMPGSELGKLFSVAPELYDTGKTVVGGYKDEAQRNGWMNGALTNGNGEFSPSSGGIMDWFTNSGGLLGNKPWWAKGGGNTNTTNQTTIAPVTHVTVQGGGGVEQKVVAKQVADEVNTNLVKLFTQMNSGLIPRTNP